MAVERVVAQTAPKSKALLEEEQKVVAFHESGALWSAGCWSILRLK